MNRQQRRAAERQGQGKGSPAPSRDAGPGEFDFAQAVHAHQTGRLAEADQFLRRIARGDPREAEALHLRGVIALQGARWGDAEALIARAVAVDGRVAVFHNNLGMALRAQGRASEAQACFRQALALRPDYPKAQANLGQSLAAAGRFLEAKPVLERASEQTPSDVETWLALGETCGRLGDNAGAAQAFQRAAHLAPSTAVFGALANVLEREVRLTEAAAAYREAAVRAGDAAEAAQALDALGSVLANLGDLDGAVAAYRQALARRPSPAIASNLLMTLHSLSGWSAAALRAEALALAPKDPPRARNSFRNSREAERPLRIGYVSADFRTHPVGFFLQGVLAGHDKSRLHMSLYSNSSYVDQVTARLKTAADAWRDITGLDDAAAAAIIEADEIDVLVDLSGHTGNNRLPLLAGRAAPVQATWLGYFGTTGVAAIDHIIADAVVAPPGEEAAFSENIVRLRAPYLAWTPPQTAIAVGPFPGLSGGGVTFGCFNNRAKLVPEVIDAWARILAAVDGSRLFLKSWSLTDSGCRERLVRAFASRGVAADRLAFEGLTPREEALAAYNRVDIALDPFPFGGCTTTADTLWMGVPLVTLAGDRWSGRMSQTILESAGLGDWVTADVEAYVAKAVELAGDLAGLAPVRADLRARLEASAFCDAADLARGLEAAYRRMWREWCAQG